MKRTILVFIACFAIVLASCRLNSNMGSAYIDAITPTHPTYAIEIPQAPISLLDSKEESGVEPQVPMQAEAQAPQNTQVITQMQATTQVTTQAPQNTQVTTQAEAPQNTQASTQVTTPAIILDNQISDYAEATVIVSGKEIILEKQAAIVKDGEIFVPVFGIFEYLEGANGNTDSPFTVFWDNQTSTASIKNRWYAVVATSGKQYFTCNGRQVTPAAAQQTINGEFMLPLKAIAKAIDATTHWDEAKSTISIYYESMVVAY